MIEDATIFRTKEQVLYDLSKALHFSPESLEANRKGRLSKEQMKAIRATVCPARHPDRCFRRSSLRDLDLDHSPARAASLGECVSQLCSPN